MQVVLKDKTSFIFGGTLSGKFWEEFFSAPVLVRHRSRVPPAGRYSGLVQPNSRT